MSPSAKIESLIAENFTVFTFKAITTDINKHGIEKKTPLGMPVWKQINRDNFRNYIDAQNDMGTAIITGKMSGISVIDFDDMAEYQRLVVDYPEIKNYRTIKTKNGVHIYCQYTDKLTTTTNGLRSYNKVDIRNNDSIVFAPPTTYKLKNGSIAKYEDLGGELLPVPDIILNDAKSNEEPEKRDKPKDCKPKTNINMDEHLNNIRKAIREGKLDFKAKSGSYDDWRDVGFIIKNTSQCETAREIFHEFSRINADVYDEKYTDSFWNTIKQPKDKKPLTIATFYLWVKPFKIANTDLEAANILFGELKDVLKSYNRRVFYYTDNIWVCDESVEDVLLGYVMNSNIKSKGAREGTFLPFVEEYSQAKNVLKTLMIKIKNENNDPDLYHKFHSTTKGKLCFNDGVLDLKNHCFTKWADVPRFTIYSTQKINLDIGHILFNPPLAAVAELKSKLFEPKYGNNENIFYWFLSRAIAGHNEDKRWATYLGNRNCGKGVEYDLLKAAFGPYVSTFELGNLLYCRKTAGMENLDSTKKNSWLLDLEFVRLAVSQEIPDAKSGLIMNGKLLKKISGGGDEIIARRNYDRFDTHFFCDATLYAQGNTSVHCDSPDCEQTLIEFYSTVEYIKQQDYDKKPDRERGTRYRVADPDIKNKCLTSEWIEAMVYLVFQNYTKNSVPIIRDESSEEIDLPQLLEETFDITHNPEDMMSCEEVCLMLPDYDKRKIVLELNGKNVNKKKCVKAGPYRLKWCFFGIRKRVVEEDEE
jgi:hypothetical protein